MPAPYDSKNRIPRISIADASALTGLSKPTIRRKIAAGELRAFRSGRSIRIHEDDLAGLFTEVTPFRGSNA